MDIQDRYLTINNSCSEENSDDSDKINKKIINLNHNIYNSKCVVLFISLILLNLISINLGNPVYLQNSQIIGNFQSGRNIRHLPCIVKRSGLEGVCMFAIDCLKSNGTHLGTCIDRFYFGSCCQIKEDESNLLIEHEISDNSIDQNTIPHYPNTNNNNYHPSTLLSNSILSSVVSLDSYQFTTTVSPTDHTTKSSTHTLISSSHKPTTVDLSTKPLILSHNNVGTTPNRLTTTTSASTLSDDSHTMKATTKFEEMILPESSSIRATTENIKLSTFQSVQGENEIITMSSRPTPVKTTTTNRPTSSTRKPSRRPTRPSTLGTRRPTTTTLVTKAPTTIQTIAAIVPTRPKPTKQRPQTLNTTTVGTRRPTTTIPIVETTTKKVVTRRPTSKPSRVTTTTTTTTTPEPLTTASFVHSTKAPRPRPKPTSSIVITPPTSLNHLIDDDEIITTTTTTSGPTTTRRRKPITTSTTQSTTTTTTTKATRKPTTSTKTTTTTKPTTTTSTTTTKKPTTTQATTTTTRKPTEAPTTSEPSSTTPKQPSLVTWSSSNDDDIKKNGTTNDWVLIQNVQDESTSEQAVIYNVDESKIPFNGSSVTEQPHIVLLDVTTETDFSSQEVPVLISTTPSKPEIVTIFETTSEKLPPTTTLISMPITNIDETTQGLTFMTTEKYRPTNGTSFAPVTITLPSSTMTQQNTGSPITETTFSTTSGFVVFRDNMTSSTTLSSLFPETTTPAGTTTSSTSMASLEGLDFRQICGKRMFPEPRIVGGTKAAFGRWPWQISLRQWRTSTYLHKCGAALLNENWAITAAHCVDNVPPSDLLLRLGEYDLAEEEEPYGYQERRVQIVASHPQFDPRTFEYDLALLRFYEPVVFQPNIIPVCVPETDENFIGHTAFVTGWGRLYEDGPLPSVLQEVSVPVIKNGICEDMYRAAGYIEHIPHIFICAGWKKGGYDSCEGDSGGPMVIQRDDKRFLLAGVISWGIGCAEPNQPGVYTRISEFRDWINQILQF